jgi:hypothetical protein
MAIPLSLQLHGDYSLRQQKKPSRLIQATRLSLFPLRPVAFRPHLAVGLAFPLIAIFLTMAKEPQGGFYGVGIG